MNKFTIQEMSSEDRKLINNWNLEFSGKPEFESIERFILENGLLTNLDEVIMTNHDLLSLDYREIKKAFSIYDNKTNIIGFLLCFAYEIGDYSSELYLQYIVLNPNYQKQGLGTNILKEFFINQKQYLGFEPENICAVVNRVNFSSLNLFKKFGFTFKRKSRSYLWAENDLFSIKNLINTCEQEKI